MIEFDTGSYHCNNSTFVYDNCDHNAESIYNVTVHGTNGIVIQLKPNHRGVTEDDLLPRLTSVIIKETSFF